MILSNTNTTKIPILTPKGKLYGMLDVRTYALHIKDGTNVRIIQIPTTGITLQYITGDKPPEEVNIPPRNDNPLTT